MLRLQLCPAAGLRATGRPSSRRASVRHLAVAPCASAGAAAPQLAAYPLRPLGAPGAAAAAPRVGDTTAAEEVLKPCRRWRDVLYEHTARAGDADWGAAGAVAALRRLARSLTIFDQRVQSQARTARGRAADAVADARFAALSDAVTAALPGLDLHRLDAVRSAYVALGYAPGVAAADAQLAMRFKAQRSLEAVQTDDAEAVLSEVARRADALDAAATLAALRSLAHGCDSEADAARVRDDARFAALLAALERHVDGFADDRAAAALASLARLRAAAAPAELLDALAGALVRRGLATGSTSMSPTHVLLALGAMRQLRRTLRPRAAAHMAAVVAELLPGCPAEKLAQLLIDALSAGVTPQPLIAAAQPLLPAAARAASAPRLRALKAALQTAGAAPEVLALLRGGASAALPDATAGPSTVARAAGSRHSSATLPVARFVHGAAVLPLLRRVAAPRAACCSARCRGRAIARAAADKDAGVEEEINWATAAFAFVVPALGGALFGYDIGVTSGALVSLTGAATSATDWGTTLTSLQSGTVVSSSLAGAVAGSALALSVGERIGRRAELLAAAALYCSGATLMATAPSLAVLVAGRALYGGGIGFAMHGAPIYIAETAPSSVRGALISAKEAFIVGGILLGYVAGAVLVDAPGGWREMLGVAALPAALLGGGMLLLPDSPRWMVQAGRSAQAAGDALAALRGKDVPRAVIDANIAAYSAAHASSVSAERGFAALLAPRNARALYAGLSLMLFQQITGQPSVLYYATPIMQAAGFASASEATQVSVILGAFKFLMTGVAVLSVDRLGRRPLLLCGVSALTAALLALAALSGPSPPLTGQEGALASAACLLMYVGAYQVSFGPIAWLIVSEVFPQEVRTAAVGLATITNFGANFGVSLVLPLLEESLGQDGTYRAFAALGVVALASIAATVPETKGKTLEQIEAELSGERK